MIETTTRCPACSTPAHHHPEADRFFHADGSENDTCWLALAEAEAEAETDPLCGQAHPGDSGVRCVEAQDHIEEHRALMVLRWSA